ncbi:Chromo (CHRromatin Organization MOdifier) domain [Aduncisulcus paluster]|uniref:Chromo (CHRromatin Organization MOdifier) domain n=1 Tax=Aduncisulcus paluster TaxID=2918883 RepID=A0ABQ5KSK0_9EUKA|nr:Chromo (CHRromatin Organization MOdifier) domain [Aduncisulcus paluster]
MVEIEDILTDSRFKVHTDRHFIVKGKHSIEELKETAASSQGEYIIEFIVDHRGETEEEIEFRVRWRGYDAEEDTWECLQTVDYSIALDDYLKDHPSLKSVVK